MSIDDGTARPVKPLSLRTKVLWAVIVCSAIWTWGAGSAFWDSCETLRWPTVPGTMVSAVVAVSRYVSGGMTRFGQPLPSSPILYPRVSYRYTVGGQTYSSGRIDLTPPEHYFNTYRLVQKYAEGKSVTVHYNPDYPPESVLEADWPIWRAIKLLIATAVLAYIAYS